MKKLLTAIAVLVICMALTGCGGSWQSEEETSNVGTCDWCGYEEELQEVECEGEIIHLCPDCMETYEGSYGTCDSCGDENVAIIPLEDGGNLCQKCYDELMEMAEYDENDENDELDDQSADTDEGDSSENVDTSSSADNKPDELIEKEIEDVHMDPNAIFSEPADGYDYHYKWKVYPTYSEQGGGFGYLSNIDITITYKAMREFPSNGHLYLRIFDENGKEVDSEVLATSTTEEYSYHKEFSTSERTYYIQVDAFNFKSLDVSWTGTGGN